MKDYISGNARVVGDQMADGYDPPSTSLHPPGDQLAPLVLHIQPDTSRLDAAVERAGRAVARVTAAVHAVAAMSDTSKHSQRCPVWLGRAKAVGVERCGCWILRDAERVVLTVLAALDGATETEGATDGR